MNNDKFLSIGAMLAVMALGASNLRAANAKPTAATPLTEAGQKLLGKYSEQLKALQAELAKDLPKIDEQQKTAVAGHEVPKRMCLGVREERDQDLGAVKRTYRDEVEQHQADVDLQENEQELS